MKNLLKILLLLLVLQFTANAQESGRFQAEFLIDTTFTNIHYYIPEDYSESNNYTLIIGFNGCGMEAEQLRDYIYEARNVLGDFILAVPNLFSIKHEEQVFRLPNMLKKHLTNFYDITYNKVIITGFSFGGRYAYQTALENYEDFDGAIGLSPAVGKSLFTDLMWNNISKVPIAAILGEEDFNFEFVDDLMKSIQIRMSQLLYLIKPGVEHHDAEYLSSEEFHTDFAQCVDFIIGSTAVEEEQKAEWRVFPNPAWEYIEIKNLSPTISQGEGFTLNIFDVLGNQKESSLLYEEWARECVIDVSHLQPGIYFVRVADEFLKFVKI